MAMHKGLTPIDCPACQSDRWRIPSENGPHQRASVALKDAYLREAAPDLYRALKAMLYQFEPADEDEQPEAKQDALLLAREALAKVEG